MMRCIRWAFFYWLVVLHVADPQMVLAQSPFSFSDSPADAPALIDADSIVYDNSRGVLTAEGNVIVVQGARALKAARIEYFEAEDRFLATGGVTILEPGGEVIKADQAELTDSLKRAVAENLGFRLSDGSRLVGRKVERVSGVRTTLTDGAFTPCAACAKDPDRAPVWRLRARKVEHDEVERDINYEDVTLDVAGLPVMYLPYFSHPDPAVKRRAGLLTPSLFFGGEVDAVTQVPYYWSIAPDHDLTFKPYFTAKSAPVAALEYRHIFEDGAVLFDGSLGYLDRTSNDGVQEKNVTRGHAFVDGDFALNDTWKLTLAGRVASDDSFVETFKIDDSDVLRNQIAAEGFWRDGYVRIGGYGVQDLRAQVRQNETPFALPEIQAAYRGRPTAYGNAFVEADARALGRNEGADSQSASAKVGWEAPLTTSGGHRIDLKASLRGDIYNTQDGRSAGASADGAVGRFVPRLVAGWRYPLLQRNSWGSLIVEPRAQAVLALDGARNRDISNEDSRAIEFDESNFYRPDRFTGRDLIDDGQRVDYGLSATALFTRARAHAFIGQSTSRKSGDFNDAAGMRGRSSDLAAAATVEPSSWMDLSWRARLSKNNFDVRRQEVAIGVGPEWLRANIAYVKVEPEAQGPEISSPAEQLEAGLTYQVDDRWRLTGRHRRDLNDNRSLLWSASVAYADECISVDLGFSRDFASQADGGGRAETLFLRVNFKHLGGLGVSQGVGGETTDQQ